MSFKHLCSAFVVAAALAAAVSCEKDKDTETLPSLNGKFAIRGELKEYIHASNPERTGAGTDFYGEQIPSGAYEIIPDGAVHPEGKEHQKYIGYYFKQTPPTPNSSNGNSKSKVVNDTTYIYDANKPLDLAQIDKAKIGYVTFREDTLYTCSISFSAFADGYYGLTSTKQVTVVRGGINKDENGKDASVFIKGFSSAGKITGTEFAYKNIGGKDWMIQNLYGRHKDAASKNTDVEYPEVKVPVPFKNCEAMEDVFGHYYTYEQAAGACPDGWRLPTDSDWANLAHSIDNKIDVSKITNTTIIEGVAAAMMAEGYFNTADQSKPSKDAMMWQWWPFMDGKQNSSGFSAIPTGYANIQAGEFKSSFRDGQSPVAKAMYWTESKDQEDGRAYYRYIDNDSNDLKWGSVSKTDKSFAISVRCVAE